jgi:hypothetical protein
MCVKEFVLEPSIYLGGAFCLETAKMGGGHRDTEIQIRAVISRCRQKVRYDSENKRMQC